MITKMVIHENQRFPITLWVMSLLYKFKKLVVVLVGPVDTVTYQALLAQVPIFHDIA